MADDFGSHLKHQRELRGISLDEIASITKIHLRYLKALETNSFDELPGEVFIKGFIRSYGRAIGANLPELISAYDDTVGKERLETRQQAEKENNSENHKQVFLVNTIVGGFLVLFILFAVWYLFKNPPKEAPKKTSSIQQTTRSSKSKDRPAAPPAGTLKKEKEPGSSEKTVSAKPGSSESGSLQSKKPVEAGEGEKTEKPAEVKPERGTSDSVSNKPKPAQTEDDSQKPVAEKENSAIIENQKAQQVQGDSGSSPAPQEKEAKLRLKIRVSENAWFNMAVDGNAERDFILPAGEVKEFEGNEEMVITIGNRRGTELKLNGKEVALPTTPDNVVRNFKVNLKLIE
ncbi:MAG: helix-turn-helix domain-containing protein [Candidatus Nitronauta litoralis]|uniref:Helix-turn-helix domain-containing protein n=1 Tax=Candidatus Nitronauta litoralis TaxID=2705533 RepID=A0A7T0BU44_9BACT|nr:MAG: helix-turn-helix domain-containing protein [Candidatus Nitronauta litoralis]